MMVPVSIYQPLNWCPSYAHVTMFQSLIPSYLHVSFLHFLDYFESR